MDKKKFHIKRHMFIFAAAVLLGIIAAYFYSKIILLILLIVGAIFGILVFVASAKPFLNLCEKKRIYRFLYRLRKIRKPVIYCVIAFFIGICGLFIQKADYESEYLPTVRANVYGKVESVKYTDYNTNIVIHKVSLDNAALTTDLKGKVRINVYGRVENVFVGDYISCEGVIYSNTLEYNIQPNSALIANDYRYQMDANLTSITREEGEKTIFEKMRNGLYSLFKNNMSDTSWQISMAIFVGDTDYMDANTLSDFRESGLAHLFAVSGLHIGLLCAVLLLLFKFLQNAWIKFFVILSALLFYNFLCGFSPSIFRSSVMFASMMLAPCFGERYDSLTGLSISFLINVALSPMIIFTVGFMMSYAVVFSIILLSPILCKILKFFPNKIAKIFAVTFSAQIGVIPVQLVYFSSLSTYGLFINLIAIPIFTLVYYVFFINIFIALIIPKSLIVSSFLLDAFSKGVNVVAEFPYSNITLYAAGGLLLLYYVCVYFVSRKKLSSLIICAVYLVLMSVSFALPIRLGDSIYMFSPHYEKTIAITLDDEIYIVTDSGQYTPHVQKFISINKIKDIDYLLLYNTTNKMEGYANIKNIVNCQAAETEKYKISVYDEGGVAVQIDKILILFNVNEKNLWKVYLDFWEADYIVSENNIAQLYAHYIPDKIFSFNEIPYIQYENYFSVRKHGSMVHNINMDY